MSKGQRSIHLTGDKKADWKTFAKYRHDKAKAAIRILGNCGNRAAYEPNEEDIRKIELSLLAAVKATMAVLRTGAKEASDGIEL